MTDDRAAITDGLRQFADWLDANPEIPWSNSWGQILMPVTTKDRVEELAELLHAEVREASYSAGQFEFTVSFGPINALIYGYEDWDAHRARNSEAQARSWAEKNGKQITDVEPAA